MPEYMIGRLIIDRSEVTFDPAATALLHAGEDPARPVPTDNSWQIEVNGSPLPVQNGDAIVVEIQIAGGRCFVGEALVRQDFTDHVPAEPRARYSFLAAGPLHEREAISEGPAHEIDSFGSNW